MYEVPFVAKKNVLARVQIFFNRFMLRVQYHDSFVCVYTAEPGSVYRHVRKSLFRKYLRGSFKPHRRSVTPPSF